VNRPIVSLLLCSLGLCLAAASAAEAPATPYTVTESGIVLPSHDIALGSQAVGVIKRILAEEGDKVAKGQPLVELDAEAQKVKVAMAEQEAKSVARLEAAKANLRVKQADYERQKMLHSRGVGSGADLEKAEFEAKYAEWSVAVATEEQEQRRLRLKFEQATLDEMTIRAPLAGVITRRLLDVGERVEMQKPLMRLVVLDVLHAIVYVPPAIGMRIQPGQVAHVEVEGHPGPPKACKVVMVDPMVDAGSRTVRVKIELPNPDGKVIAGSRATVRLHLAAAPSGPAPEPPGPAPAPQGPAASPPAPAKAPGGQ